MQQRIKLAGVIVICCVARAGLAGTEPYFTPLTQSAQIVAPNHASEINAPWVVPAGMMQSNLTSMQKIEADIAQSVIRTPGFAHHGSMWDMVAFGARGEYIFIPHETMNGAGASRYNIEEDRNEILFKGTATAQRGVDDERWEHDYGAFDPATLTPYGTILFGEEWSGLGRIIEVLNPYTQDVANIQIKEKHSIANVSHEGLRFSRQRADTLYYVDEDFSGSIYKCVASDQEFNQCQTFVLQVVGFEGDASKSYNDPKNQSQIRLGSARWLAMTDKLGKPTTRQNPFENNAAYFARPGRLAADELGATPYGRPEDIEVGVLSNGDEVLYFTATAESKVYSVQMKDSLNAVVRVFASEADTPKNLGFPVTTGTLDSPDNLAQDALGNIYIVEDKSNNNAVGGDIWFARDVNGDGVAESLDHFMSLQVDAAEATGMIFKPDDPTQFVVSVQHPQSTNLDKVPGGFGDALWLLDIKTVAAPVCTLAGPYKRYRYHGDFEIHTCSDAAVLPASGIK